MSEDYLTKLEAKFNEFRAAHFTRSQDLFEARKGSAVVFKQAELNLLIPPFCTSAERQQIIEKIPPAKRHKHFASMRSSQALAQSVFGTIEVLNRLPKLSAVKSEDGRLAFGNTLCQTKLCFEKEMQTLEEPNPTSVDVWFDGPYRIAVECKLTEREFGTCSMTRRKPTDKQYCDGNYAQQAERIERCALTEIGVGYWRYIPELFGWPSDIDHRPCPFGFTYQLVRNVLAACIDEEGKIRTDLGHVLIIYDERNPAIGKAGTKAEDDTCDRQWRTAYYALRERSILRRLSWQSLIAQWPSDPILDWLKEKLDDKYGLLPD